MANMGIWVDLLAADRIVMLVYPDPREAVLDTAARLLSGGSPTLTPAIADGLRRREQIGSTAIGRGVAIPHCRSNAFSAPRAAFLRLSHGIEFAANDGEPVDLLFAMCVPEDSTQQHLQTLSELAEAFAEAEFREALRDAPDIAALRARLLGTAGGITPERRGVAL
jgi:PTS system nitrogen regulatory IIA component